MIAEAIAAAAFVLGDDAPGVLARFAGPIGEELHELVASGIMADKADRAAWSAFVRAPVPAGIRGIDPSWIETALDGVPEQARVAVAAGGGTPARVWLARWACARFVTMPQPIEDPSFDRDLTIDDVVAMPGDRLRVWLDDVGADQLAVALAAAGPEAIASGIRVAGERVAQAAARIHEPPRKGNLGPIRAAIERCRGIVLDEHSTIVIGARTIAPYVAGRALARERIMLRLPRDTGLAVGAALLEHAADPVERAPSWSALGRDTIV